MSASCPCLPLPPDWHAVGPPPDPSLVAHLIFGSSSSGGEGDQQTSSFEVASCTSIGSSSLLAEDDWMSIPASSSSSDAAIPVGEIAASDESSADSPLFGFLPIRVSQRNAPLFVAASLLVVVLLLVLVPLLARGSRSRRKSRARATNHDTSAGAASSSSPSSTSPKFGGNPAGSTSAESAISPSAPILRHHHHPHYHQQHHHHPNGTAILDRTWTYNSMAPNGVQRINGPTFGVLLYGNEDGTAVPAVYHKSVSVTPNSARSLPRRRAPGGMALSRSSVRLPVGSTVCMNDPGAASTCYEQPCHAVDPIYGCCPHQHPSHLQHQMNFYETIGRNGTTTSAATTAAAAAAAAAALFDPPPPPPVDSPPPAPGLFRRPPPACRPPPPPPPPLSKIAPKHVGSQHDTSSSSVELNALSSSSCSEEGSHGHSIIQQSQQPVHPEPQHLQHHSYYHHHHQQPQQQHQKQLSAEDEHLQSMTYV